MIMNMLTGAHAALIPLITDLHDEATSNHNINIPEVIRKLNAVLAYESENWVQDMTVDMIIDFFRKLPDEARLDVIKQIELHDGLPLRLCLYLMDTNVDIAKDMIEKTDVLDADDLLYRIQSGQVHEMIAVARRKNLSTEVLNALVESKELEVYVELLNNPSIRVQEDVIKHLNDVASRSPRMAWHMVVGTPNMAVVQSSQAARL